MEYNTYYMIFCANFEKEGILMILHNVGYDHRYDPGYCVDLPQGSGNNLLLLLKSEAIFTLNGEEILVPAKTFFIYPQGMAQHYRSAPHQYLSLDWIQFLFENEEDEWFRRKYIPWATPIPLEHTELYSYCIKSVADENGTDHLHKADSIGHYFWLMCNKVSECLHERSMMPHSAQYETLLIIRNKIYSMPYLNWTVESASQELQMSRSSFQHHYKAQFGVTFMHDLIESRLSRARMLLLTTNMTVQDIASQCGYRSYEHFSRQFRSGCGLTPSQFRTVEQNKPKGKTSALK